MTSQNLDLRYEKPPTPAQVTLLRKTIRATDDPQQPWPAADLIHALALPSGTRRALLAYLGCAGTHQLTLLALMDLVLLDKGTPVVNLRNSRLLAIRRISKKGYKSAANALTTLDMGSKANALWRKRIAPLKGRWQITPSH